MANLQEYVTKSGRTVWFEVESQPVAAGMQPASRTSAAGGVVAKLEDSLVAIADVADQLFESLESMLKRPEEVTVEFGAKLGGESGIIFAKGSAEVNFKVSMTWKNTSA